MRGDSPVVGPGPLSEGWYCANFLAASRDPCLSPSGGRRLSLRRLRGVPSRSGAAALRTPLVPACGRPRGKPRVRRPQRPWPYHLRFPCHCGVIRSTRAALIPQVRKPRAEQCGPGTRTTPNQPVESGFLDMRDGPKGAQHPGTPGGSAPNAARASRARCRASAAATGRSVRPTSASSDTAPVLLAAVIDGEGSGLADCAPTPSQRVRLSGMQWL